MRSSLKIAEQLNPVMSTVLHNNLNEYNLKAPTLLKLINILHLKDAVNLCVCSLSVPIPSHLTSISLETMVLLVWFLGISISVLSGYHYC